MSKSAPKSGLPQLEPQAQAYLPTWPLSPPLHPTAPHTQRTPCWNVPTSMGGDPPPPAGSQAHPPRGVLRVSQPARPLPELPGRAWPCTGPRSWRALVSHTVQKLRGSLPCPLRTPGWARFPLPPAAEEPDPFTAAHPRQGVRAAEMAGAPQAGQSQTGTVPGMASSFPSPAEQGHRARAGAVHLRGGRPGPHCEGSSGPSPRQPAPKAPGPLEITVMAWLQVSPSALGTRRAGLGEPQRAGQPLLSRAVAGSSEVPFRGGPGRSASAGLRAVTRLAGT